LGDVPQDGDRQTAEAVHGPPGPAADARFQLAETAESLPPIHRDPVGRIVVAHSLRQTMPVLTSDGAIPGYRVATIW
jgi:PIN domain nuclease of toxin-antitoxin system